MKVLGITGGIGSGKSTILSYIKDTYPVQVIEADDVGHQVMMPGQVCYKKIVELFGDSILQENGEIHRGLLGERVFREPDLLKQLNQIIHPAVKEYIQGEIAKERKKGQAPFFVIEAALLIEDHYELICDELWYIYTKEDIRRKRLKESRNYTDEKIDSIFKKQLSEKVFREHCSFVVDNNDNNSQVAFRQIDRGLREHEFM
jgi:dephospho-CoA kinase